MYWRVGRLDESIASFRTALSLSPGHPGAQYAIGVVLLMQGERRQRSRRFGRSPLNGTV